MACPPFLTEEDIFHFRTKLCRRPIEGSSVNFGCRFGSKCQYSHDKNYQRRCPFYLTERMAKRSLRYLPVYCPDLTFHKVQTNGTEAILSDGRSACPRGGNCPYSHSSEEVLYHPLTYKTTQCEYFKNERDSNTEDEYECNKFQNAATCSNYYCPRIHATSEKRFPSCYYLPYCPQWAEKPKEMPSVPGAIPIRGGRPTENETCPLPEKQDTYFCNSSNICTDYLNANLSYDQATILVASENYYDEFGINVGDAFKIQRLENNCAYGENISGASKGFKQLVPLRCFFQMSQALLHKLMAYVCNAIRETKAQFAAIDNAALNESTTVLIKLIKNRIEKLQDTRSLLKERIRLVEETKVTSTTKINFTTEPTEYVESTAISHKSSFSDMHSDGVKENQNTLNLKSANQKCLVRNVGMKQSDDYGSGEGTIRFKPLSDIQFRSQILQSVEKLHNLNGVECTSHMFYVAAATTCLGTSQQLLRTAAAALVKEASYQTEEQCFDVERRSLITSEVQLHEVFKKLASLVSQHEA